MHRKMDGGLVVGGEGPFDLDLRESGAIDAECIKFLDELLDEVLLDMTEPNKGLMARATRKQYKWEVKRLDGYIEAGLIVKYPNRYRGPERPLTAHEWLSALLTPPHSIMCRDYVAMLAAFTNREVNWHSMVGPERCTYKYPGGPESEMCRYRWKTAPAPILAILLRLDQHACQCQRRSKVAPLTTAGCATVTSIGEH